MVAQRREGLEPSSLIGSLVIWLVYLKSVGSRSSFIPRPGGLHATPFGVSANASSGEMSGQMLHVTPLGANALENCAGFAPARWSFYLFGL
jgi:hypothetical protein